MIGWIYSDPVRIGFASGVRRDYQKMLEATKTIVGASNRSRIVTDIMYDDFVQFEKSLDVVRHPPRLVAPLGASLTIRVRGHGHLAASRGPATKSQNPMV